MNGDDVAFRLLSPLPWPLLVVVGIALAGAVVYLYRRERSMVSRRMGLLLTGLRVLMILLLIAMLFEPLIASTWRETLKGRLILLLDKSLSMDVRDPQRSPTERLEAAEALDLIPPGLIDKSIRQAYRTVSSEITAWRMLSRITYTFNGDKTGVNDSRQEDPVNKARALLRGAEDKSDETVEYLEEAIEKRPARPQQKIVSGIKELLTKINAMDEACREAVADDLDKLEASDEPSAALITVATRIRETATDAIGRLRYVQGRLSELRSADDAIIAAATDDRMRHAMEQLDGLRRCDIAAKLLSPAGGDLLDELSNRFDVVPLTVDTKTQPVTVSKLFTVDGARFAFECDGTATDIAAGLEQAADPSETAADIAGVLLITDGRSNVGEDPMAIAKALAGRDVKIFPFAVGSAEPAHDIAISKLEATDTVFARDEVQVAVELRSGGFEGKRLPVKITREGETVAEEEIRLAGHGERQTVELSFVPEEIGSLLYTASVPVQQSEIIKDNNSEDFWIQVIEEKMRVLYVEGEPRWEFRFLKNALLRDRNVELNTIVVPRDAEELPRGSEKGQFPQTREGLYRYDAIILGDLSEEWFFPGEVKSLEKCIGDNGSALIVISGPSEMPYGWSGTALEKMLPVVLPTELPGQVERRMLTRKGFQPVRTSEGRRSPLLRMALDPGANGRIWQHLRPMYRHAWTSEPKPGASVLLSLPTQDDIAVDDDHESEYALMTLQSYGVGRVLFMSIDETWRWRYKTGDRYHHKFWGQVMRWATAGKVAGRDDYVRLGTHKTSYAAGEAVKVNTRVLDKKFAPLQDGSVSAVLFRDGAEQENVALDYIADSGGRYRGQFVGLPNGNYTVRLRAPHLPDGISKAHVSFTVRDEPSAENIDVSVDLPLLASLARATGGRLFTVEDADDIPEMIPPATRSVSRPQERHIWRWSPFLMLLCGVLVTEWVARKRAGLM